MSVVIESTKRIDELYLKGQEEGLTEREIKELLFLMEAQGLKVVMQNHTEKLNVH